MTHYWLVEPVDEMMINDCRLQQLKTISSSFYPSLKARPRVNNLRRLTPFMILVDNIGWTIKNVSFPIDFCKERDIFYRPPDTMEYTWNN